MGNFLEEIVKGGLGDVLGSVFGGGASSGSGGGIEDIIKQMQEQMGGGAPSNISSDGSGA